MPEFTLTLRRGIATAQAASAWYLASPDCEEWLREIAGWNVPCAKLQLIPIPSSASDRSVTGVLIVAGPLQIAPSSRCTPYASVVPRLYAPCNAQLQPDLDERELNALLIDEYLYVWHPGRGLVAIEQGDVLRPSDILAQPRCSEHRWNRAVPGLAIGGRMNMLAPIVELSVQQIVDDARDDIGTEQDSLAGLPETPTEPGDGLFDKTSRALAMGAAGALYSLAKLLPTGPGGVAWINKLKEMAANKMNQVMTVREDLRHKEISRLLHLLEQDPDQGLRFALPLTALPHRGLAPPTNRLTSRKIEFDLGRLAGGKPANFWDLGADYRRQLNTRYRELANREMHLGRHRRAAYILAELLGDFDAAALALANGHHYREAAIIFRDRLRRPLEAAKCLENGGLLSEALEQYEELKLYEQAGNLHAQIGNSDRAATAYLQAAQRFRGENDFLSAARIWEDKLHSPEQAIKELQSGWPNSTQAVECVRALFALFGRLGQHTAAEDQVREVEVRCPESQQYVRTAEVLSDIASGKYPDVTVREKAAAATLRVVSERLRLAYRAEAQILVASLSKLAPQDRLLERDGRRFIADFPVARAMPVARRNTLRKINTIKLGLPGQWREAIAVGDTIVAAAIVSDRIGLRRCNYQGNIDRYAMPWTEKFARENRTLMLAADAVHPALVGVYVMGEWPLVPAAAFGKSDAFLEPMTVGALSGTRMPVGIARGQNGRCYSIEDRHAPVLQITNEQGDLIGTHHFEIDASLDWQAARLPLVMQARRQHLYIGVGRHLLAIKPQTSERKVIELASPICRLAGSADHSRSRIVAGLTQGACMLWDPAGGHKCVSFASDMGAPYIGINSGGFVIVAAGSTFEVYDSKESKLTLVTSYNKLPTPPIAVLTGTRTDQFAIMCQDGDVLVFEI